MRVPRPLLSGKRRVFNLLRLEQPISRAQIAAKCALTRPAVSGIIDEMIREGLVEEVGRGNSSGGKPPRLLALVKGARCAIGIELGDEFLIHGVLCDFSGNILAIREMPYTNIFESILEVVAALVHSLATAVDPDRLAGVGIAVSGIVDVAENEVVGASTLDICRRNLAKRVEELTGVPVLLEKRPNAAALAESLFGAGREFQNLLYITSGLGVGAGVVLDGEIYRGVSGRAGEIGQMQLDNGKTLEECARPSAIEEAFSRKKGCKASFDEVLEAYRIGDPDATALIGGNAQYLVRAAQTAADLFDPEAVILGGRALEFGEEYFEAFVKLFHSRSTQFSTGGSCEVRQSHFGRLGVAVGGAQVILDRLIV